MKNTAAIQHPLRASGAILLISCYELGHQPLGIAQPMGFLSQASYTPAVLDLSVQDLDETRIQAAHFIGISVPMHTALTLGLHVAKRIRHLKPWAHICFYGLYASLNDKYLLENSADSVIGGEFEIPLLQLIEQLNQHMVSLAQDGGSVHATRSFTQGSHFQGIPGVSTRESLVPPSVVRQSWHTESQKPARDKVLLFPTPMRKDLPSLRQYAKLEHLGSQSFVGYVEASRGCLHTCLHCPIVPVYKGRFFLTPEKVVLADIQQQVEKGAAHITFGDPDFLNGPKHARNILRMMHREFPNLTFDVTTKIEHIIQHHEIFDEFSSLGCLFVVSAVESFSNTVLHYLEKGHTRDDIFSALDILQKVGITLRPSLVAFTPWTSLDDYVDMFHLVETHHLIESIDPVQYAVRLLVPPGSALLDPPASHTIPIHHFLTQLDQSRFQYLWTHPDPRMDILYHTLTEAVEEDTKAGVDQSDTFYRLKKLVHEAAGIPYVQPSAFLEKSMNPTRPPRLTEPWFCCAEPTKQQFELLDPEKNGPPLLHSDE